MRRRRLPNGIAALASCVLIAAVLAWPWLAAASRIDRAHFDRLALGMPQAEVERILGGPPRNECRTDVDVWVLRDDGSRVSAEETLGGPPVRVFAEIGA